MNIVLLFKGAGNPDLSGETEDFLKNPPAYGHPL